MATPIKNKSIPNNQYQIVVHIKKNVKIKFYFYNKRGFLFLRRYVLRFFIIFILLQSFLFAESFSKKQSDEIVAKITAKYQKMYDKYDGVESIRTVNIKWYYPDSMELAKTEDVVYKRFDYFYKDLKYKVLSYKVDGKKEDNDDYDPHESAPGIPIFDKNGKKQYKIKVVKIDKIGKEKAYKISVIPKNPNTRHFKGFVWVTVDGLNLIKSEGTSGEMRFGCKSLYVNFKSKDFGDFYSFTSGCTKVNLSVLGLYRRFLVFKFKNTNIKPILKGSKK